MERAAESYSKVVDLAPLHLDARISLSILQQQLGHPEKALEALEPMYDPGTLAQDANAAQQVSYHMGAPLGRTFSSSATVFECLPQVYTALAKAVKFSGILFVLKCVLYVLGSVNVCMFVCQRQTWGIFPRFLSTYIYLLRQSLTALEAHCLTGQ